MILQEVQGIGREWIVLDLMVYDQGLRIYSECSEKLWKCLSKGIAQSSLCFLKLLWLLGRKWAIRPVAFRVC